MTHHDDFRAYFAADIRRAEAPVVEAAPTDAVMRRAAWAVADVARTVVRAQEVIGDGGGHIYGACAAGLIGAGDNGGDGLYALVELARSGMAVHAICLAPGRAHERALVALRRAGGRLHEPADPEELGALLHRLDPAVVLDAIVGLGASGAPRPLAGHAAGVLEQLGTPVVAVDVPSGIDPDTGVRHPGAIRPTATVTFGLYRRAHLLASTECGAIELADIGIDAPAASDPADPGAADDSRPAETLTSIGTATAGALWPVPGASDNKYSGGVVAIRAGSDRFPGAAVLASHAAVMSTSAMVRYVGPCREQVLAGRPEIVASSVVTNSGRAQAWVAGPGMGTGPETAQELAWILSQDVPVVLDADALRVLADHPSILRRREAPLVLTPHAGEFDALAGTFAPEVAGLLADDRAGVVRALVRELDARGVTATVLLKGRITLIDDGRTAFAQDAGTSWSATPGSGDVLAGMVGAVLAAREGQGPLASASVPKAVAVAQVVHSVAARLAAEEFGRPGSPIGASDLLGAVPEAVAKVRAVAG